MFLLSRSIRTDFILILTRKIYTSISMHHFWNTRCTQLSFLSQTYPITTSRISANLSAGFPRNPLEGASVDHREFIQHCQSRQVLSLNAPLVHDKRYRASYFTCPIRSDSAKYRRGSPYVTACVVTWRRPVESLFGPQESFTHTIHDSVYRDPRCVRDRALDLRYMLALGNQNGRLLSRVIQRYFDLDTQTRTDPPWMFCRGSTIGDLLSRARVLKCAISTRTVSRLSLARVLLSTRFFLFFYRLIIRILARYNKYTSEFLLF